MSFEEIVELAAYRGVMKAYAELASKGIVDDPQPTYTLDQVLTLHLRDKRFKKVTKATLRNWESGDAPLIKNVGSPRKKVYRESDLLRAMSYKGRRRANLPSSVLSSQ